MFECYRLYWVVPLTHIHKTQKHSFLKLPSTSGLQPQRVSWSDNKLAPLPGKSSKLSFLGRRHRASFDDRQSLDITRLYIFYMATPLTKWLSKELTPGQTQKAFWHQFLTPKKSSARAKLGTDRPPDLQPQVIQVFRLILSLSYLKNLFLKS